MVHPASDTAAERLRQEHAGRRILLVDDNPIGRAIGMELLRVAGLSAETAEDGAAAVERAGRGGVDLVLMDVQMPGMDGLEATRSLRAAGCTLPIIAMTGNTDAQGHAACLAAGMDDHIPKPIEAHRLYEALLRWLPASARPDGTTLVQRLARIDGLDPSVGLGNVGGSTEALARVLRRFADTYRGGVAELVAPPSRRARRAAAHALRGAAATLGAVALQGRLEDLERADDAGLDDAELDALSRQALDELRDLVAGLDAALAG